MAEAWPIFELNAGDLELVGKSLVYGATLDSPIAKLNLALWVIDLPTAYLASSCDSQQHAGEECYRLSGNGQDYPDL